MSGSEVLYHLDKSNLFGHSPLSNDMEVGNDIQTASPDGLDRACSPTRNDFLENAHATASMSEAKLVYHVDNQNGNHTGSKMNEMDDEGKILHFKMPLMAYIFDDDDFLPPIDEELEEEAQLMAGSIEKGSEVTQLDEIIELSPDENTTNNNSIEEVARAAEATVVEIFSEPFRRCPFAQSESSSSYKPSPSTMTDAVMVDKITDDDFKLHHVSQKEDNYLAPELKDIEQLEEEAKKNEYKMEIVWPNVGIQIGLHLGAFYGLYLACTDAKWQTNLWMLAMTLYAGNSITAGAHRMWCHKAYKANLGVRLFYLIGTTMSIQNDVIEWARDHRVHHKWADSDADPHNINRGFFFAHMGWLMVRKHPKVKEMGKKVDMSDLEADPLLAFQRRHYVPLIFFSLYFLSAVPVYCWGEKWTTAYFVAAILRLALQLHGTWFINSAAHTFGYKPFDTKVTAVDTLFYACLTNGEAWHNYHHTFPQDYRASEFMWKGNMSAWMIDFFAYMGWVWDRKTMSKEAIERQKLKGDLSRPLTAAHTDEDDFDYIKRVFSHSHHD